MKKQITEPSEIKWIWIDSWHYEVYELPFWLNALYTNDVLSLYGKDYLLTRVSVNNIEEANCVIYWVIEAFRQVQWSLFELWII